MAYCNSAGRLGLRRPWFVAVVLAFGAAPAGAADPAADFKTQVQPVLEQFCVSCHSADTKKGGVSLEFGAAGPGADHELWLNALKMLRAGMMPPKGKERPTAEQVAAVERWVKYGAFGIDPNDPDPGRVTLRRLNRTEYRNTVRDLLGVEFDPTAEFPADDTGHGFDTVADVLTLSPLLLEKYIASAKATVARAVPTAPWVPAERRVLGQQFAVADAKPAAGPPEAPLVLSYTKAAVAKHELKVEHAGKYQVVLDLTANEQYVDNQFDYNKCRVVFRAGDKVLLDQEFVRQGGKPYRFEFDQEWAAGAHALSLEIVPLTPKERQVRSLTIRLREVVVRGPLAKEHWVRPANYARFFPGAEVPDEPAARAAYTRTLLREFATRAYRRTADDVTVERLAKLAEVTAAKPGQTPEGGVAQAMTVILASPRFIFREEFPVAGSKDRYPLLDEFSLATRLSYLLWSSTPDDELLRLAGENKLRAALAAQVSRMLADKRSGEFVRNFAGQWLQARNIDTTNVNAAAVLAKDEQNPNAPDPRARFRELNRKAPEALTPEEKKELEQLRGAQFGGRRSSQYELTPELRRAMRQETELTFDHVLREDRSLLELLDSDYTFLNERLAKFYDIDGVAGDQMRKVALPAASPRGGVLTQATVLVITSNPDRTSPVKRGLFVLENILGVPPPPPPPDVTPLEQAAGALKGKTPTLRETLKLHRADPKCSSCHNRMDPIGLAFENFNALGRWRDKEVGRPIEAGGVLLTGEAFQSVKELKRVLVTDRRLDYYRCVTEKLFVYAVGRGPEAKDQHTLDEIVARLEAAKGKPSALMMGVVESPAFQRRGAPRAPDAPHPEPKPAKK